MHTILESWSQRSTLHILIRKCQNGSDVGRGSPADLSSRENNGP